MKLKRLLLVSALLLSSGFFTTAFSQQFTEIKNVKGSCVIKNITPGEAKRRAITRAKEEALRRAGVAEHVSASKTIIKTEDNEAFNEFYNSITNTDLEGIVSNYKLVSHKNKTDEFGNLICEVVINATVVTYETESDPEFDFKITGVKEIYEDKEKMNFSILPYQEGYLRIFLIDDNDSSISLFPNDWEKIREFSKEVEINFPIDVHYTLEAKKPVDRDVIVFVFTKKNIPFKNEINYDNILEYIYSIPRNQRALQYYSFVIRK